MSYAELELTRADMKIMNNKGVFCYNMRKEKGLSTLNISGDYIDILMGIKLDLVV